MRFAPGPAAWTVDGSFQRLLIYAPNEFRTSNGTLVVEIGIAASEAQAFCSRDNLCHCIYRGACTSDEPADNPAPPTIEDAQRLVQTISDDKAKLKAYCELGNLYEEVERAEEKNDMKELDALGLKIDSLEQQVGPDYRRVMNALKESSIQTLLKVRS